MVEVTQEEFEQIAVQVRQGCQNGAIDRKGGQRVRWAMDLWTENDPVDVHKSDPGSWP